MARRDVESAPGRAAEPCVSERLSELWGALPAEEERVQAEVRAAGAGVRVSSPLGFFALLPVHQSSLVTCSLRFARGGRGPPLDCLLTVGLQHTRGVVG